MPNRQPPARGYEMSDYQLGRSNLYAPLRDFLKHYAKRDRITEFYDFVNWGETANFTLAQTQTSTNFTVIDGLGGVMAGTTVNTTTASISAIGKTRFNGNNNCDVEFRFKVDTAATQYIAECGWVNAVGTTGASAVADIDVPSVFTNVTNCAVFGIWQNQTHTSVGFVTLGSFTSQTVASTLMTAASASFTAPAADTYLTVRVLLLTNSGETGKSKAFCWVNGKLVAQHQAAAGAINGQAAIYPYIYLQSVTAITKVMTVDYIRVSQDRVALSAASE